MGPSSLVHFLFLKIGMVTVEISMEHRTDCKPGKIAPLRYTPLVPILILFWNLGPLKLKIIFEHKFSRLISIPFVKELVERI